MRVGKRRSNERWAEYVEDLYKDDNREEYDLNNNVNEFYSTSSEAVIKKLPKGKACSNDNISAELLQEMRENGIAIMTSLINKIYQSCYILEDFRRSIFVSVPKINSALERNDFRTIAPKSHASKVLLHLIKKESCQ